MVLRARRIDPDDLRALVEELAGTLEAVRQSIDEQPVVLGVPPDEDGAAVEDGYHPFARGFVQQWEAKLAKLNSEFCQMEEELHCLWLYFCHPRMMDITTQKIIGFLCVFLTTYEQCFEKMRAKEDLAERSKRRREKKAQLRAEHGDDASADSFLDDIQEELQGMGPQKWGKAKNVLGAAKMLGGRKFGTGKKIVMGALHH